MSIIKDFLITVIVTSVVFTLVWDDPSFTFVGHRDSLRSAPMANLYLVGRRDASSAR